MTDNYWLNEQLNQDDGFVGNTQSQQDDQLMSSFLNYLDGDNNTTGNNNNDMNDANNNQLRNRNMSNAGANMQQLNNNRNNNFNQPLGNVGGVGVTEQNNSNLGISPSAILSQQMMQQQQQQQQQQMNQMNQVGRQNQMPQPSPQQQMQQLQQQQQAQHQQRPSQDTNALIQSLLGERNNNPMYQQQQQPQQLPQNQGLPPAVFSPSTTSQTIPPQVPQQQRQTPQSQPQSIQNQSQPQQQTPQFNANAPLDKAAMIAALQQRNSQNPERFQQQFLQQQLMNQQQQQQNPSMSPSLNNQGLSNQQQQQQMFQQLQQQQALRLQQLRQQQQAQQAQQQGSIPPTPHNQDNGMQSPMISNQVPQNQFSQQQFSAPNQISRNGTPFQQNLPQQRPQQQQPMSMHQTPGSQHPSVPPTPQQQPQQVPQSQPQQHQQMPGQAPTPAAVPGQQQNLTPDQIQQRKIQQQISATQIELFMKTLTDFMKNRGTPITSVPMVADKKIHLFFFYAIVARLGGSASVSRQQQWPFVAQKLALPVDQNPQLARDLAKAYIDYLLPFEQYASTPEGQRDLQARRQAIQKQHEAILRQLKQSQQHQQQQIPQQMHPQQQQSIPNTQPSSANVPQQHMSPQIRQQSIPNQQLQQQPTQAQVPTPVPQFQQLNNLRSAAASNAGSPMNLPQQPQQAQQQFANQQFQAQQMQKRRSQGSQRGSSVNSPLIGVQNQQIPTQQAPQMNLQSQVPTPVQAQPQSIPGTMSPAAPQEEEVVRPNVIRNYVPDQRLIELHAGYDIKALNQLGEQIDSAKPIFLFAPELGAINIHALTMSLESGVLSEVNTALNTALVTSADNNLPIPLSECPEFLEALTTLGIRTLDQLMTGSNSRKNIGVENVDLDDLTPKNSAIDDIFSKYVKNEDDAEECEIIVDSFSAQPVEQNPSNGYNRDGDIEIIDADADEEKPSIENLEETRATSALPDIPDQYAIPSYLDMLVAIRSESEHPFSKIHTRTADDPQVLLIDQLTTISMVLRNISFYDHNAISLATSDSLKEFIFKIIHSIAIHPDKFIFTRRRLGFLKDALIILMNISHLVELKTHNEVLAVLALVLAFGSEEQSDGKLLLSEYSPSAHKYQSHGVDVLAKLLVRDPPNRSLFQAVLTGSYDSNLPFTEVEEHKKLVALYVGEKEPHLTLLSKVFKYLVSIIPLTSLGLTAIIQERDAAILQSLIASILVTDMIPTESISENYASKWLSSRECVGNGLIRLGLVLAAVAAKPTDSDTARLISARSFTLVNSLVKKALEYIELHGGEFSEFNDAKLFLPSDAVLGALLTSIDPSILNQILTLAGYLKKINTGAVKQAPQN